MQKVFSKEYMQGHCGCYSVEEMENIFFLSGNNSITIEDIINSDIPLIDKYWFMLNQTGLTEEQIKQVATDLAELILPIYEKQYPNDMRPREAIEADRQFTDGHISLERLIEKNHSAAIAYYEAWVLASTDILFYSYVSTAATAYASATCPFAYSYAVYSYAVAAYDADMIDGLQKLIVNICERY